MKIILFRHAERQTGSLLSASVTNSQNGPPLSALGLKQAEKIVDFVKTEKLPRANSILVSPKTRALMTLSPLAKQLKLEAIQNPELDERDSQENGKSFSRRVQNFLRKCEKMQGSIFLVTHLDWIEEALIRIPANVDLSQSKYQHWNPASYMHFQVDHELWQLEEFGEIKC